MVRHLIDDIREIRSRSNINTMSFLKLLFELDPEVARELLDKIEQKDRQVQELSELLHVMDKERTDLEILDEIEQVRAENNTLWMDVVRMCFELDPERAREIFSQIKELDKRIQDLSGELNEKSY